MILKIDKDHQRFRQIVKGRIREDLRKFLTKGELIGKEGKHLISIPVRGIDLPHFRYGDNSGGVGAGDGKEGLDLIECHRPDVVFSDVAMPEMNGFELADAMRARPDLAHIPIVFMTASVQREQIDECFRHGAAGHLAKPFTMAELRARMAQFSKN